MATSIQSAKNHSRVILDIDDVVANVAGKTGFIYKYNSFKISEAIQG